MSRTLSPAAPAWAWLGNALALLALLAVAIAFGRWQADAWWVAAPRDGRWIAAGAVVLAYAGFCGWLLARARRQAQVSAASPSDADAVVLAWASQTGFAQQLAEHTAQSLRDAGTPVQVLPLDQVTVAMLRERHRVLFIVSTTGEGDPPDHVLGFTRGVLGQAASLDGLRYAVLALGDRSYDRFCAFGRRLDQWLHHHGAQPLFDRIEVDAGDAGALRHWQHHLGQLAGHLDLPDWSVPAYRPWRLQARQWLNPGSAGGPAYHLALTPDEAADLDWQAGDLVEIGPRHAQTDIVHWLGQSGLDGTTEVIVADERLSLAALLARSRLPDPAAVHARTPQAVADSLQALPHREYSIASLPADGSLQLLVRQMRHPDGRLGSGSGWLTAHAAPGERIDLRIRRNPSFHPPSDDRPLILIGNGTGLAGLRALLKARIGAGHYRNWLLFGERNAAHDFHYHDEIEAWLHDGRLQRLDLAFSRDQDCGPGNHVQPKTYVQDRLRGQLDRLRDWLADGAAVYVCGSLEGMAPGVDAVLREAVGLDTLEAMATDGRYRRDVY
ncbi:sulfite reductase subunit alpha [Lysobacter cavernae]|uniref:NADPH--hemoprotein reductase n=1 Tax=Lysobacter cavernae TaxID=1685901 RepID=A0ABV7RKL2_9GAMM